MNYRHQFHAGNFADVMKHVVLLRLIRSMQKKDKGFLYLDTHAGRGCYDLAAAAHGDSLARKPEWPEGIGRLWALPTGDEASDEYVNVVRQFDRERGNREPQPRFYPGSPWIMRQAARPQDRIALCEKHPEEYAVLAEEFRFAPNATVTEMDGYIALRAMLPPLERRALVLIDPPFEAADEFANIVDGLRDGLSRLPGGVFAVWYPLTERAKIDAFFDELRVLNLPPTLALELFVADIYSPLKMRGCGLLLLNPPWQFEATARVSLDALSVSLRQSEGATSRVEWLVPET